MKLEEKKISIYGNSKVINVTDWDKNSKVYVLDEEMLNFLTNKNKNG